MFSFKQSKVVQFKSHHIKLGALVVIVCMEANILATLEGWRVFPFVTF